MRGEVSPAARRAVRDRAQVSVAARIASLAGTAPTTALVDVRIEDAVSGDLYEKSESLRNRMDELDQRITDLEP